MKKQDSNSIIHNEDGGVLIMVALVFSVLVLSAGIALELGRMQLQNLKLQQATDAAALAAGVLGDEDFDRADRQLVAERNFSMNYPDNYTGSTVTNADAVIVDDSDTVRVSANGQIDAIFVKENGSVLTRNVGASSESIIRKPLDLDVVVIADVSGSMKTANKIVALREATDTLADILMGPTNIEVGDKVRIALVPYATTVPASAPRKTLPFDTDINDIDPVNNAVATWTATGRTAGGPAALAAKQAILNAPDRDIDGETAGSKIWIFMTDGQFNEPSESASVAQFESVCNDLEAENIVKYTIAFGAGAVKQPLKNCVSDVDRYFFDPQNGDSLVQAFATIANALRNTRLVD